MINYIGELAALLTAISWSFTSIFFTIAATKIGAFEVNKIRLYFASFFLMTAQFILYGNLLPLQVEANRWWWLGVSGVVGLIIGDGLLLQAFVLIGARLSMLLMSLVPIASTLLAWLFLNERLTLVQMCAILVTLAGICWVVLDKVNNERKSTKQHYRQGILCGIVAALCQAIGLIAAKKGMAGNFSPLTATLMRISISALLLLLFSIFAKNVFSAKTREFFKTALLPIFGGSFFGPFVGIWLSLVAIKHCNIGIASTLLALPPIFLIPLTHWIFKEKISFASVSGTIVAIVGVAIIFLS